MTSHQSPARPGYSNRARSEEKPHAALEAPARNERAPNLTNAPNHPRGRRLDVDVDSSRQGHAQAPSPRCRPSTSSSSLGAAAASGEAGRIRWIRASDLPRNKLNITHLIRLHGSSSWEGSGLRPAVLPALRWPIGVRVSPALTPQGFARNFGGPVSARFTARASTVHGGVRANALSARLWGRPPKSFRSAQSLKAVESPAVERLIGPA